MKLLIILVLVVHINCCIHFNGTYFMFDCPGYQELGPEIHQGRNFTVNIWGSGGGGCGCGCSTGGGSGAFISAQIQPFNNTYYMINGFGGKGDGQISYSPCYQQISCLSSENGDDTIFNSTDGTNLIAGGGNAGQHSGIGGLVKSQNATSIIYAVNGNNGSKFTYYNSTGGICDNDSCYCKKEIGTCTYDVNDYNNFPVYSGNGGDSPVLCNNELLQCNNSGYGGEGSLSDCCSAINNPADDGEFPGAGGGGSFGNYNFDTPLCDNKRISDICFCWGSTTRYSAKAGNGGNGLIIIIFDTEIVSSTTTRTNTPSKSVSKSISITASTSKSMIIPATPSCTMTSSISQSVQIVESDKMSTIGILSICLFITLGPCILISWCYGVYKFNKIYLTTPVANEEEEPINDNRFNTTKSAAQKIVVDESEDFNWRIE